MQPIREFFAQTFGIEAWLAMLLAIAVIALLVSQVARLLFNQLDRWAHRSENAWDEALVEAAEAAGITLIAHENERFKPWWREARRLIDAALERDVKAKVSTGSTFW